MCIGGGETFAVKHMKYRVRSVKDINERVAR